MKTSFLLPLLMATIILTISSCKKDDPEIPHEEELITTLKVELTDSSGTKKMLSFVDLDGDGGQSPTITSDTLDSQTEYQAKITLLNESESPAESIDEEVLEEAEEHQMFFLASSGLSIDISYNDQDANGNPLGLESIFQTNDSSSGTLTVILRHEPNKSAQGVAIGDINNASGETDIEVNFNVVVQ